MRRALYAIALCCSGCATQPGVDLALVPDPNVNSDEQVLEWVDSIVMIVDSAEPGLYRIGDERSQGNVQIENADTDDALEVVVSMPVLGDRLPLIRLMQGSMPDASLELRFLGIPPERGPAVAIGRVQGVHLSDPIERLDVPFNLRPDLLPPRVTEVAPSDADPAPDCVVSTVYMMFSRPIDPATVAPAVSVEGDVSSTVAVDSVTVDPDGRWATLAVSGLTGSGSTLRYRLVVTTALVDREGRALDQIPSEPGDQPLEIEYELLCTPGPDIPLAQCAPGVDGTCPLPRFSCVEGACIPDDCGQCLAGNVCDSATSQCVADCRLWGETACPVGTSCDAASGVCVAP